MVNGAKQPRPERLNIPSVLTYPLFPALCLPMESAVNQLLDSNLVSKLSTPAPFHINYVVINN